MPVQPFESVTVTTIGKLPRLRRRAGERAVRGERQTGRQRAGRRERGRADGAGLREVDWTDGVPAGPAGRGRVADGDGLAGDDEGVRRARAGAAVRVGDRDDDRERARLRRRAGEHAGRSRASGPSGSVLAVVNVAVADGARLRERLAERRG